MRFLKRKKIQFTDRTHPYSGIVSAVIGMLSILIMCGLFIGSGIQRGNAGLSYGALGTINMFGSLIGFILGVKCYQREDTYRLFPNIGVVLNSIVTILYMILYGTGIR